MEAKPKQKTERKERKEQKTTILSQKDPSRSHDKNGVKRQAEEPGPKEKLGSQDKYKGT